MLVQNLRNVRVPGVIWVALFVIAGALLQQYLGQDSAKYEAGLVILAALAKLVDVNLDQVMAILQSVEEEGHESESVGSHPTARGEATVNSDDLLTPVRLQAEGDESPPRVDEGLVSKGLRMLLG